MRRRLLAALIAACVCSWAPQVARADDAWNGAFDTAFGFFVGGGAGGGVARLKLADDAEPRWAVTVPLNLRVGFDVGKYGLAVMLDTHYTLAWGPSRDQGPTPIKRQGQMQMLSMLGAVIWRTPSPFYVTLGAGVALTTRQQDLLENPVDARAELLAGVGFLYRFKRAGDNIKHYPFGMSVSFETRYYVPWDPHFINVTLQMVLTFYFVFTGDG